MKYVLDTNVLLHIIRNSKTWEFIDFYYKPFEAENETFLSFVSVAEVLSIAKQSGWGKEKMMNLAQTLAKMEIMTVSGEADDLLIQGYVEIDSYSQNKGSIPLPQGISSRNMGKNDIWIAATAYILEAELITTDRDFLHLDQVFFKVNFVEQVIKP